MSFTEQELEALRLLVWDWMSYEQARAECDAVSHPLLAAIDRLNDFLDPRVQGEERREFLSKILGNYFWQVDQH